MKVDAIHRQLDRKGRRMRTLFRPPLDRFVGNEPGIAPTTQIAPAAMAPARNVALVLIGHAEGEAIERRLSLWREVENIFVAIVQVTRRADRLEMPARDLLVHVVRQTDRLDPVDCVLE